MNQIKLGIAAIALSLTVFSCTSYNAFQKAKTAEQSKDWDQAVLEYQKAVDVDPNNTIYKIDLKRAKLEASRVHFEKGKTLRASALNARDSDQMRLMQLAVTELELTVRLDPTNQFAAVEYGKAVNALRDAARANQPVSIDEIKRRAKANITKSQPPQLVPSSDQPISLSFPKETPVKEIYKALGNAFGINILFDQAVKDDRIAIELKDVTAQQALERLMQAANHFYKALDDHTIIVVPDNPQARRDYEDLVIRTFYLSNGDAEQVTNVVRTMIEARNVFPLKALNAITIRDTADKVRIAEKIIEANDKAKAEVVVDVELLQVDLDKTSDIGAFVANLGGSLAAGNVATATSTTGTATTLPGTLNTLRGIRSSNLNFTIPTITYNLAKSLGNAETLANPELRISEGEKATLHIGQRVPVPVTTFTTGVQGGTTLGSLPATSFQYQDVGIKVSIEPRVHHNQEVTLKLTVEVSDVGSKPSADAPPSFNTRTIEATIRLKDGETNFLAGLIQETTTNTNSKTPFLGDIPILGRLFTENAATRHRTDLMLTMTPHIIRMPDITEEDLAPMWVGTQSNLSFRGLSPRLESQSTADPFTPRSAQQFRTGNVDPDGNPIPAGMVVTPGTPPNDPFRGRTPNQQPPIPNPNAPQPPPQRPQPQSELSTPPGGTVVAQSVSADSSIVDNAGLAPRIEPQPMRLAFKAGEEKIWNVVGMDLDGLTTQQLMLHYDPHTLDVSEVVFGPALVIDPRTPPVATIDREHGTVRITSSNGKPLQFYNGGGDIASLRVRGGSPGDTYLVLENPNLTDGNGTVVNAAVSGGHAKVD
ncbi:MAG TPA: secretin N-terminal domain-containing protein [Thermoanaerobaculia bacterium]|nr:secretin N-terminal domain-containing protein [Thermoanaerobaculia bacterium]